MVSSGAIGGGPINSQEINGGPVSKIFKTNDICPVSGKYKQIETGNIDWTEKGDRFAPYYKEIGQSEEGRKLVDPNPVTAHYELVKEENGN